jgi:glycosyltransferase involved in cell wall biosynthesis
MRLLITVPWGEWAGRRRGDAAGCSKRRRLLRERGCDFHLLIVGGDSYNLSPEYAASLSGLADRLGLSDAVTMTGQAPDAGAYMEHVDVLVNACDPEPFGIVLLEGMARGVSVLAGDSGGPSEFIDDGETGVLARSGAPADLADALQRLLTSPALRRRLGRADRERFNREFTDDAMRERYFAELETVLPSGGGRRR